MSIIRLDGDSLSLEEYMSVVRFGCKIDLDKDAKVKMQESRDLVDKYVKEEKVVYGITTGFGKFSDVKISKEDTEKLQKNLIMSHSCGVGEIFNIEETRGIMLLRVNALAKGYSGIRISIVETLIEMINEGVFPIIPQQGSLGSSGDLAPLAHMVLVMFGEGEAIFEGEKVTGKIAMNRAGIKTIELTSKEGLALINGTQVTTAVGAIAIYDALNLSKMADISASLTNEALNGIVDAYDPKVHKVRKHIGQINTGKNLLSILEGSKNTTRQGELRVQDAYSLRCTPQVNGASKDCLYYVKEKVEIEMNAATDNPLIFPDQEKVISAGNFHGEPMAQTFDFMKIGIAELANISERRLERLVNPALSEGLPAFLVKEGGLNSGFMIVQYAAAALVSENKTLAHPASVDSIPSSANQEDHVAMGTIAARHARDILNNSRRVVAMEILAACQGIDLRGKEGLGKGTKEAYHIIRKEITMLKEDRIMYKDIDKVVEIMKEETIVKEVEKVVGVLL